MARSLVLPSLAPSLPPPASRARSSCAAPVVASCFVRNPEFKAVVDKMQGPLRQVLVEFLERSCTAQFSGFLLYKELAHRLKKTNPVVAETFSLMSSDEANHAGDRSEIGWDVRIAVSAYGSFSSRDYLNLQLLR